MTLRDQIVEAHKSSQLSQPIGVRLRLDQFEFIRQVEKDTKASQTMILRVLLDHGIEKFKSTS